MLKRWLAEYGDGGRFGLGSRKGLAGRSLLPAMGGIRDLMQESSFDAGAAR